MFLKTALFNSKFIYKNKYKEGSLATTEYTHMKHCPDLICLFYQYRYIQLRQSKLKLLNYTQFINMATYSMF